MRAGTLRESIGIMQPTATTDAEWGPIPGFELLATVSASVIARGGSEAMKDEGVSAVSVYDIIVRYRADVCSTHRITWSDKTLEIVSAIDPDGRKRQLSIEAKEIS